LFGKLIYFTITRPDFSFADFSFAVSVISQLMQNPCVDHWNVVIHILSYIKKALG